MSKKNLPTIAGVTVAAVLVVLAVLWLVSGMSVQAETRSALSRKTKTLQGLYETNPFPSEENIEAERASLDLVTSNRDEIRKRIAGVRPTSSVATPIGFQEELERTEAALRREGMATAEFPAKVPADFHFGFDDYVTVFANKAHVPRLMTQMELIADLTRVVFSANILKLEIVDRERFDGTKSTLTASSGRVRQGRPKRPTYPPPGMGDAEGGAAGAGSVSPGLKKERVTLVFQCSQDALVDVLNRLATHTRFVTVPRLTVVKTGVDLRPAKVVSDAALSPDEQSKELRKLPEAKRLVSGIEIDDPLRVTVVLDIYWVEPVGDAAEAAPVS